MTKQYTSAGKEVLRDGVHFADACSPDEARDIAVAMNEGLARAYIELGECGTCKGVGAHQPNCVDRPKPAKTDASISPGPINCNLRKQAQNEAYPRTCERCGLGPCPFFFDDGSSRLGAMTNCNVCMTRHRIGKCRVK